MIKGSKAGMSLKNMLTNMANPTDKMSAALEKLGMTADKSGSYLKTTAEGCTDLEATVKSLKEGTEGMTRSQKASLIATVAGKNALPGVMSLINASTKEYDSLSEAIDNSTSTVSMFNENMNIIGLKGKQSSERIDMLKEVFNKTELSATALGLSSKDLGYSISLLGDDSKVASKDVEGLLDIVESMDNASGKVDKFWRSVGNAENVKIDDKSINQLIDYNGTIGNIQNSTVGLSEATKENYKEKGVAYERTKEYVQSLIKENMTVDEANKVLKQYGLSAEKISLSTLTMSQKTDYLRQAFIGMSKEQIKAKLDTIGLGESFDEVNEIVGMSDDKYNKYKENLKTIQGLSDRMAKSIDETTVASFYALASAMGDSLLGAFDRLKPALLDGSEALTKFFSTWKGGEKGNYSFSGFEKGLNDLESKVAQASNNIPSLMDNMFSGINRFINGGALDSFLNMGTDIIQGISKGISQNKDDISQGLTDLIGKICDWININSPAIEQAGGDIIDAIKVGIGNNEDKIGDALESMYGIINTFIGGKKAVLMELGISCGTEMIEGILQGLVRDAVTSLGGGFAFIITTIGELGTDMFQAGAGLAGKVIDGFMSWWCGEENWSAAKEGFASIMDYIWEKNGDNKTTSKAQDAGLNSTKKYGEGATKGLEESKKSTDAAASKLGDGISDNVLKKLETMDASSLKVLEDELKNLQSTTGEVASGIGANFGQIKESVSTNLVGMRNSATESFISLKKVISTQFSEARTVVTSKMISIAKVVGTQSQNARNSATTSFISMSKVISTQCTNARTAVVSKMMSINAVVNTQAWKARDNATRAFMSLAAVVRTQMSNALTSVRNAMSQIASATNRTLTTKVNVSKTITTTNVAKSIQAKAQTFSLAATRSLGGINSLATASYGSPVALASTSSGVSGSTTYGGTKGTTKTNSKPVYFDISIPIDGKEIAKASAKYMDGELKIINTRSNRKKGR